MNHIPSGVAVMLQYARVDSRTAMTDIKQLLMDHWDMPPPKLIVSIIGGAKDVDLNDRQKTCFKRWLAKAMTSSGKHEVVLSF